MGILFDRLLVVSYIGNLSPDEIVRRIEGDEKGDKIDEKTKSKSSAAQKAVTSSNTNNHTLKDIPSAPLSVVSKTVKDTSSKRKSDKDKRHNGSTDKVMYSPKRSVENGNVEVTSNAKVDETAIATVKDDNAANNDNDSNTGNNCSEQSSDGDSGAATVCIADEEMIIRTDEEVVDVDDEEQYMSADEGVNSGASDDVYHTDELSGTSGSRDLMSDGGNFRADDEPVIPNSAAAEEAEFIPVTAKSRKKTAPPAINVDKKHSYTGIVDKGGNSRGGGALKDGGMGLRQRRNSAQLTIETGTSSRAYHHSPSPNERVVWSQHGSKWHGNSSGMQSKGTVERVPASSSLHTSRAASPDRRSSQPSNCPISNARYAAAVANTSHKVLPSDLTVYSTGNQGSFAKALLSPPLKDGNKTSAHVPSQSLRGTLHTSVSGSALNDTKKNSLIYDPSDENANPPLPSARRAPNSDPNMTNTVNTHVAIPSRSWADIAKSSRVTTTATCSAVNGNASGAALTCKSRVNDSTQTQTCSSDESVPREMTSPSSSNVSNPERASSVDSSANDSTETAKESECAVASCSISSDAVITQIPDNDEGIRLQGISFFYDPNEPTANFDQRTPIDFSATDLEDFSTSTPIAKCSQESAIFISDDRIPSNDSPKSDNQNSEKETICDKKDAPPNSVVLNLENGKTITLPAMGTNDLSKVVLVEDRKHVMLVEQLARHWKNFEQCGPAPIRYKELMKKRPKATKTSTKNNIANVKTAKC
ncbi:unnamed protein product [Anisakis simplex]|uniref:HSF_DOMAIN domain-containing protein n=1 Tax=Anisakis simplex TaxID=6269 RepID=A0A0M3K4T1_ANISI|nr:unnamed protein product [Anisakis simplex]